MSLCAKVAGGFRAALEYLFLPSKRWSLLMLKFIGPSVGFATRPALEHVYLRKWKKKYILTIIFYFLLEYKNPAQELIISGKIRKSFCLKITEKLSSHPSGETSIFIRKTYRRPPPLFQGIDLSSLISLSRQGLVITIHLRLAQLCAPRNERPSWAAAPMTTGIPLRGCGFVGKCFDLVVRIENVSYRIVFSVLIKLQLQLLLL